MSNWKVATYQKQSSAKREHETKENFFVRYFFGPYLPTTLLLRVRVALSKDGIVLVFIYLLGFSRSLARRSQGR